MRLEYREEKSVVAALRDHTMIGVVAAAANLSIGECLAVLLRLQREGRVRQCAAECWELVE